MKLVYWFAKHKTRKDKNIRTKTKKDAIDAIRREGEENYFKIERVEVSYRDGFDLLKKCLSGEREFWGVIK